VSGEAKSTSPSGRYVITVEPWEPRMSLWVETPELVDTRTGRTLIGFRNTNWSLDAAEWQSDTVVKMTLRKYPGDHEPPQFEATVDCEKGTATIGGVAVANLADLEAALEQMRRRKK
jgi:hypothetical protein